MCQPNLGTVGQKNKLPIDIKHFSIFLSRVKKENDKTEWKYIFVVTISITILWYSFWNRIDNIVLEKWKAYKDNEHSLVKKHSNNEHGFIF